MVDFANEVGGTRAVLRGPAAAAGEVPLLTDEAKARMKARMHSSHSADESAEGARTTPHDSSQKDGGGEL